MDSIDLSSFSHELCWLRWISKRIGPWCFTKLRKNHLWVCETLPEKHNAQGVRVLKTKCSTPNNRWLFQNIWEISFKLDRFHTGENKKSFKPPKQNVFLYPRPEDRITRFAPLSEIFRRGYKASFCHKRHRCKQEVCMDNALLQVACQKKTHAQCRFTVPARHSLQCSWIHQNRTNTKIYHHEIDLDSWSFSRLFNIILARKLQYLWLLVLPVKSASIWCWQAFC